MSTSLTALLVYGWPIEIEVVTETVTRYNEKTGEPYEKSIKTDDLRVTIGESFEMIRPNDDVYDEGKIDGLSITTQYYAPYKGTKADFIGIVSSLDHDYSHGKVGPLTKKEQEAIGKMTAKAGHKPSYHLVGYLS